MRSQRVFVVDGSRLVRDLLRRVIEKTPEFEVVREVDDWEKLPAILQEEKPEWLFFVLSPEQALPDHLTTKLLLAHPMLHIVAIWTDGSHVKTEWLSHQKRDFTGLTLDQLTVLLEKEWWINASRADQ